MKYFIFCLGLISFPYCIYGYFKERLFFKTAIMQEAEVVGEESRRTRSGLPLYVPVLAFTRQGETKQIRGRKASAAPIKRGEKRWVGINPQNPEDVREKVDTALHPWLIWAFASLAVLMLGVLMLLGILKEPTFRELFSYF